MRWALATVMVGSVLGAGLAWLLGGVISNLLPEVVVLFEMDYLLRQAPVILGVAVLAEFTPLGRILRLDPMTVFQA